LNARLRPIIIYNDSSFLQEATNNSSLDGLPPSLLLLDHKLSSPGRSLLGLSEDRLPYAGPCLVYMDDSHAGHTLM